MTPTTADGLSRHRVPWCPRDGCGRPNGAAPPALVTCAVCRTEYVNFDKVCPACRTCNGCGRVGKRWYRPKKTDAPATPEDAFWSAAERAVKDFGPLLMFADWLTERNGEGDRDLAAAMRWMAKWQRRPWRREHGVGRPDTSTWHWNKDWSHLFLDRAPDGSLPRPVYELLVAKPSAGYASYRDAVRDLSWALERGREIFDVGW